MAGEPFNAVQKKNVGPHLPVHYIGLTRDKSGMLMRVEEFRMSMASPLSSSGIMSRL